MKYSKQLLPLAALLKKYDLKFASYGDEFFSSLIYESLFAVESELNSWREI